MGSLAIDLGVSYRAKTKTTTKKTTTTGKAARFSLCFQGG